MIKSDAQLERSRQQVQDLRDLIRHLETDPKLPDEVRQAVMASHKGLLTKVQAEIVAYEDLKRGVVRLPRIASPQELGAHVVKFRIALGITQQQLAEMVGVSRQTINKHEEQEYQLADVSFLSRVVDALGLLPEVVVRHKVLTVKQPGGGPASPDEGEQPLSA